MTRVKVSYFKDLWRNFKWSLAAIKVNFKRDPLKWLYFELNPSWYVRYDGWKSFKKEVMGWFLYFKVGKFPVPGHLPTGFILCLLGLPVWVPFVYGTALEAGQLIKAKAEFINPINSLIDILTYGAGGVLVYWLGVNGGLF